MSAYTCGSCKLEERLKESYGKVFIKMYHYVYRLNFHELYFLCRLHYYNSLTSGLWVIIYEGTVYSRNKAEQMEGRSDHLFVFSEASWICVLYVVPKSHRSQKIKIHCFIPVIRTLCWPLSGPFNNLFFFNLFFQPAGRSVICYQNTLKGPSR